MFSVLTCCICCCCSRAKWVASWGISLSRLIKRRNGRDLKVVGRECIWNIAWRGAARASGSNNSIYIKFRGRNSHAQGFALSPESFFYSPEQPLQIVKSLSAAHTMPAWFSQEQQSRRKNIFTQRQIIMLRVSFYGRTILREQKCNPRPHTYLYTSAGRLYAPDFTFKTLSRWLA